MHAFSFILIAHQFFYIIFVIIYGFSYDIKLLLFLNKDDNMGRGLVI